MQADTFIEQNGCKGCPFLKEWSGPYGMVSVPACDHPKLKRMQLIPDELDACPKYKRYSNRIH